MKISIITATFNSEKHIESCLDSVFYQSFENIEHIIVDGCSVDNTLQKIQNHKHRPNCVISEKDDGIYDALNKGVALSSGDIIGFLHSDDIYANSNTLKQIISIFENDPTVDLVYGNLEYVSENDSKRVVRKWISRPFNSKLLKFGWMPPHPTIYFKRKILDSKNIFNQNFRISADYMFILEMFLKNDIKVRYIPDVLIKMTMGGISNRSLSSIILKSKEDWIALYKNNFGFFGSTFALILKNLSKVKQFF